MNEKSEPKTFSEVFVGLMFGSISISVFVFLYFIMKVAKYIVGY